MTTSTVTNNWTIIAQSGDGNTANFTIPGLNGVYFDPRKKYAAALVSCNIPNSINNISASFGNNTFSVTTAGPTTATYTIPDGCYNIDTLNNRIQKLVPLDSGVNVFTFVGDSALAKCNMSIAKAGYQIKFNGSLGTFLGFTNDTNYPNSASVGGETITGPNRADIQRGVTALILSCSIIENSYNNGQVTDALKLIQFTQPPGYPMITSPPQLIYMPVSVSGLKRDFTFRVTDQVGNPVDLNGEKVVVELSIIEVDIKQIAL